MTRAQRSIEFHNALDALSVSAQSALMVSRSRALTVFLLSLALVSCASSVTNRDGDAGDATSDVTDAPQNDSRADVDPLDVPPDGCAAGTLACADATGAVRCIDAQRDAMNCGGCGIRCCASCVFGQCVVTGFPLVACPTGPDGCHGYPANLATDLEHCGGCDIACAVGEMCLQGRCTIECGPPSTRCGVGAAARCVDTTSDPSHCGSCDNVCAPARHAHGVCLASVCSSSCDEGFADCNGLTTDGCEADVTWDDANCGSCGSACASPSRCVASNCRSNWGSAFYATGQLTPIDVATDAVGNVYVVGYFLGSTVIGPDPHVSAGDTDAIVIALDAAGAVRWSRSIGASGADIATSVSTTPDGDVVVGGSFEGSIAFDSIVLTSAGGSDGFVASLDGAGNVRWATRFGGGGHEEVHGIAASGDGRIAAAASATGEVAWAGRALTPLGATDAVLATLDAMTGSERWATRGGGASDDVATRVRFTRAGELVAIGTFRSPIVAFDGVPMLGAGRSDVFVVSYSGDGSPRWQRAFGGSGDDSASGLDVGGGGDLYVAGGFDAPVDFGTGTQIPAGQSDAFVVALDSAGRTQWALRFGGGSWEEATGVSVLTSGNVGVAMSFTGAIDFGSGPLMAPSSRDLAIATFDPTGAFQWSRQFVGTSGSDVRPIATAAAPREGVAVAGYFGGAVDFGSGPVTSPTVSSGFALTYRR